MLYIDITNIKESKELIEIKEKIASHAGKAERIVEEVRDEVEEGKLDTSNIPGRMLKSLMFKLNTMKLFKQYMDKRTEQLTAFHEALNEIFKGRLIDISLEIPFRIEIANSIGAEAATKQVPAFIDRGPDDDECDILRSMDSNIVVRELETREIVWPT